METRAELQGWDANESSLGCQIYCNIGFIDVIVFPNTDLLTFYSTFGELVTPAQ